MSSAALEALKYAQEHGQAERLWIRRCEDPSGHCMQASGWRVRGKVIVVTGNMRGSAAYMAERDLPPRVPAQAWVEGIDMPSEPVWIGCRHEVRKVNVSIEGTSQA